jgi:AcrR family transcriptional regulator
MSSMNEAAQPCAYLKKEVWLEKALLALSKSGGHKPRIGSLVAEIRVSRGSFYWHFNDRAEMFFDLLMTDSSR